VRDSGIEIVSPTVHLPKRLRRKLEDERLQQQAQAEERRWRIGAEISFVAAVTVVMLNATAMGVAQGFGMNWALLPFLLSILPLLWLGAKAMFETYPRPQDDTPAEEYIELPADWRQLAS